ncbi:unnamed protein product [Protopolystoma xenopodis]|uniref:Sodium/calcium exchanger membrane region domain-containing protein n=1 Tax=Protopolystoma xenopodis TaxID=117903 RepID=A0A448WR63_9PLAT|nr:unnamed protein product [Protopolystoma xenopodis]
MGIGVAWSIASIYHAINHTEFKVEAGSLGFSVTVFCIFAFIAILLIFLRRRPSIGGELGGPKKMKYLSGAFLIFLWLFYVLLSAMENYCHIEGF